MNENRKGLLKIHDTLYKNQYDDIKSIFKDFRPTHIEFRYWENNIWYLYGVCRFFDPLNEGDAIPSYIVEFKRENDGVITINYIKE